MVFLVLMVVGSSRFVHAADFGPTKRPFEALAHASNPSLTPAQEWIKSHPELTDLERAFLEMLLSTHGWEDQRSLAEYYDEVAKGAVFGALQSKENGWLFPH